MGICGVCTHFAEEWLIPRFISLHRQRSEAEPPLHGWHQPSWNALAAAAMECDLCSLILAESFYPKVDTYGNMPEMMKEVSDENASKLRWQCFGGSYVDIFCKEKKLWISLAVALDDESADNADESLLEIFNGRLLSQSAGSARNVHKIKNWISFCRSEHELCKQLTAQQTGYSGRRLPTRLLDVGTAYADAIRLVLSEDLDDTDKSPYIALTYCWGRPKKPFVTTATTIGAHRKGMPLHAFPETLADAITLTRNLGYRYIWIDALCIIQQDQDDWEREAAQMHRVYSHADLVLGSDTSADVSSGMFAPRDHRAALAAELPVDLSAYSLNGTSGPVRLQLTPLLRWSEDDAFGTLDSRAWCYQEQKLSRRYLHFGKLLTHWACANTKFSEASAIESQGDGRNRSHIFDLMQPTDKTSAVDLHQKWAQVVEDFTKRALTEEKDVFPALLGIARVFDQKGMLGAYFAGLWQEELHRHLLWRVDRTAGVQHRRPKAYRAPSWSWASVIGPVSTPSIQRTFTSRNQTLMLLEELGNDGRYTDPVLRITAVTMTTEGPTGFGEVKKGHMKVHGILKQVKLRRCPNTRMKDLMLVESLKGDLISRPQHILDVEVPDDMAARYIEAIACPILNRLETKADPYAECEALFLQEVTDDAEFEGLGRAFKRIGHGRLINQLLSPYTTESFTLV